MDLFGLDPDIVKQAYEMLKAQQGGGLVQSVLLFLILLSSRGLRKEIVQLGQRITDMKEDHESRFVKIENRLNKLEFGEKS